MTNNVTTITNKLEELAGKIREATELLEETNRWIERFEGALTAIVKKRITMTIQPIKFKIIEGAELSIDDYGYVSIRVISSVPIPEELHVPLKGFTPLMMLMKLAAFKKLIENVDQVISQIDEKIQEIDKKNKALRRALEEIKDALEPILIAHELKPDS